MVCHQRTIKQFSTENFTAKSSRHPFYRQGGSSSRIMGEYSRRYTPSSTEDFTATSSCTSYSDPFQDKGGRISGITSRIMELQVGARLHASKLHRSSSVNGR